MWSSVLCLSFITAVSAAPISPFFNYLAHYGGSRPAGPSTQVANDVFMQLPTNLQPGVNGPVSMEIIFPQRFPGTPAGGAGAGAPFPQQAFIKYSLPKAPGRKSVEIYYPYDFSQRQVMPNIPMVPQVPNAFPFDYQPQTVPQQQPARAVPPLPQADEQQQPQIQQDQPVKIGQP